MTGKRVILVPMAMGFDLAQGWAAYLKREVEGWGGVFETRDPNWSVEAGAQAITDAIASDPKPDVLVVHARDLNSYTKMLKKAQAEGDLCHPDRQSGKFRGRCLYRQRLGPPGPA